MTQPQGADAESANALDDAIHALAQPLTALTFLLELGVLRQEPKAWLATLQEARKECLRAVRALEQVRAAAHLPDRSGDPDERSESLPCAAAQRRPSDS